MTRKEIEEEIQQLKMDYMRIQGDLDKLESVGGNVSKLEQTLARMEEELSRLRTQLANTKE
ncbi:SE1832 family protein [Salirhabdus sp. Marseille-P4669]|uniref:SE1832 family protein n=1 Tax=Salirhabdus sp. Marseille-P4669 TaxID=2042310 RepID=UPI000C7B3F9D|nr:SE1832 family protein [Salirhabdus sp. Marseille-P4669]